MSQMPSPPLKASTIKKPTLSIEARLQLNELIELTKEKCPNLKYAKEKLKNFKKDSYRSLFEDVIESGNLDIVPHLLKAGLLDIHEKNKKGLTPLHFLGLNPGKSHYLAGDLAELLIEMGADINAATNAGVSIFESFTLPTPQVGMLYLLMEKGVEIKTLKKSGSNESIFEYCVNHSSLHGVALLIANEGWDIHKENTQGQQPMFSFLRQIPIFKAIPADPTTQLLFKKLLEMGADMSFENKEGVSPEKILKVRKIQNDALVDTLDSIWIKFKLEQSLPQASPSHASHTKRI